MSIAGEPNVLLAGFGIQGYRSFVDQVRFAPLRKVNLLAGQNNVGKSNVIRFLDNFVRDMAPLPQWLDQPQAGTGQLRLSLAYRIDLGDPDWPASLHPSFGNHKSAVRQAFSTPGIKDPDEGGLIWVTYSQGSGRTGGTQDAPTRGWEVCEDWADEVTRIAQHPQVDAFRVFSELTTGGSSSTPAANLKNSFAKLFPTTTLPKVEVVSAFRQILTNEDDDIGSDHSGLNLIRKLARLQNPDAQSRADRLKFDQINLFAQSVLEDATVTIEIPAQQDLVLVHQAGRVLPLDSLGTGIHQTIILAAAATTMDRTLVCIEEPEIHMHPLLQRKFIRYLQQQTTNQYVIATHSAHMLDYEAGNIIHLRHDGQMTQAARAASPQLVADVCADLGYRPSDLIQTNAVIWVEGPSDRIYLTHWIETMAKANLIEGIHYSVMFFGGALMSHLSPDDPDVKEFISLRRLNRHIAILFDSDRSYRNAALNETKKRLRDGFNDPTYPGFAWITECRTIENFVPEKLLKDVVKDVHPNLTHTYDGKKWSNPLSLRKGSATKPSKADKVGISRKVCEAWTASEIAKDRTLRLRIEKMIEFIEDANGFDHMGINK